MTYEVLPPIRRANLVDGSNVHCACCVDEHINLAEFVDGFLEDLVGVLLGRNIGSNSEHVGLIWQVLGSSLKAFSCPADEHHTFGTSLEEGSCDGLDIA